MDTSVKAPICTQGSDRVTGSEDCLYVKIYTTHVSEIYNYNFNIPYYIWSYLEISYLNV